MKLILFLLFFTGLFTDLIAQTIPAYIPTNGLVGWWPFNGNANDESGNGNNGTASGANLTTDRYGNINCAYSFDGQSDYIQCNNSSGLSSLGVAATITGWFNTNTNSVALLCKSGIASNNGDYRLFIYATNPKSVSTIIEGKDFTSSSNINYILGNWNHIAVCKNGNQVIVYINGLVATTINSFNTNFFFSNLNDLFFGYDPWGGIEYFNGKLDDIAIWNRALSAAEVQQLYLAQSQNPMAGGSTALATNFPTGIAYQAVARDSAGQVLSNTSLGLRFTLRDSSLNGPVVYTETHALTTSSLGLFSTSIGSGTPVLGAYASINWMGPQKFLSVELNTGTGYQMLGNQQLLSVPYANVSGASATVRNASLPVYIDNSSALLGGLQPGQMYRTATGDLKIVY